MLLSGKSSGVSVTARKSEAGQSILESLICMFVLLIMLFGFLEVFNTFISSSSSTTAAMAAARSASVGFADYLVQRCGRCTAIAASGRITYPTNLQSASPIDLVAYERVMIPRYAAGEAWLDDEYWHGDYTNVYSGNNDDTPPATLSIGRDSNADTTTAFVRFQNYPMPMLGYLAMFYHGTPTYDISKNSTITNHAGFYLEGN